MEQNTRENKRELLIDSEFKLIETSAKLSSNIKTILYEENIELRRKEIEYSKSNIEDLLVNTINIAKALRIDTTGIIGRL